RCLSARRLLPEETGGFGRYSRGTTCAMLPIFGVAPVQHADGVTPHSLSREGHSLALTHVREHRCVRDHREALPAGLAPRLPTARGLTGSGSERVLCPVLARAAGPGHGDACVRAPVGR